MKKNRIDLHCDTITMLHNGETLEKSHCSVSIENLLQSDTVIQCFAAFIPTGYFPEPFREKMTQKRFARIYGRYEETLQKYEAYMRKILCYKDIESCVSDRKVGALLTLEDGEILGGEIERIKDFYKKGVRLVTLTWNTENGIGYPKSSNPQRMNRGLKPYGFQVVEELERLGIAVDVSHLSDGGFWDVMSVAKKPPLASHSNARAVWNHARNLTDEMIRAIAERGGVIGVNFGAEFLDGSRGNTAEAIARHMLHIYQIGGQEILALGSDFDGIHGKNEIANPSDCEKLYEKLKKQGLSETIIEKIWYQNADRYFRDVLKEQEK